MPIFPDSPSSKEFQDFVEENARQHAELHEIAEGIKTDLAQHSYLVMDELKAIRAAVEKQS